MNHPEELYQELVKEGKTTYAKWLVPCCQKKNDSYPEAEANDNSPRTDDNRRCPGAIGVDGGDSYAQSPS